jgi:hypothetical protein
LSDEEEELVDEEEEEEEGEVRESLAVQETIERESGQVS